MQSTLLNINNIFQKEIHLQLAARDGDRGSQQQHGHSCHDEEHGSSSTLSVRRQITLGGIRHTIFLKIMFNRLILQSFNSKMQDNIRTDRGVLGQKEVENRDNARGEEEITGLMGRKEELGPWLKPLIPYTSTFITMEDVLDPSCTWRNGHSSS